MVYTCEIIGKGGDVGYIEKLSFGDFNIKYTVRVQELFNRCLKSKRKVQLRFLVSLALAEYCKQMTY